MAFPGDADWDNDVDSGSEEVEDLGRAKPKSAKQQRAHQLGQGATGVLWRFIIS